MSCRRADHCEPDAGVPARRLDDRLSRLEISHALPMRDHAEREAILHRAEWIERFDLHEEIDDVRRETVDLDAGSVADRAEDAVELGHREARAEDGENYVGIQKPAVFGDLRQKRGAAERRTNGTTEQRNDGTTEQRNDGTTEPQTEKRNADGRGNCRDGRG